VQRASELERRWAGPVTRPGGWGRCSSLGREGRLVLLLDGLDEVAREDRGDAESLLRDLSARWPASALVVTSRPIGYRRPASELRELELLPFDGARRREFLARWLGRSKGELARDRAKRREAAPRHALFVLRLAPGRRRSLGSTSVDA